MIRQSSTSFNVEQSSSEEDSIRSDEGDPYPETDGSTQKYESEKDEFLPPTFAVVALTLGFSCGFMTAIIGIVVPQVTAETHPKVCLYSSL